MHTATYLVVQDYLHRKTQYSIDDWMYVAFRHRIELVIGFVSGLRHVLHKESASTLQVVLHITEFVRKAVLIKRARDSRVHFHIQTLQ